MPHACNACNCSMDSLRRLSGFPISCTHGPRADLYRGRRPCSVKYIFLHSVVLAPPCARHACPLLETLMAFGVSSAQAIFCNLLGARWIFACSTEPTLVVSTKDVRRHAFRVSGLSQEILLRYPTVPDDSMLWRLPACGHSTRWVVAIIAHCHVVVAISLEPVSDSHGCEVANVLAYVTAATF